MTQQRSNPCGESDMVRFLTPVSAESDGNPFDDGAAGLRTWYTAKLMQGDR